jgi:hypothetical protein
MPDLPPVPEHLVNQALFVANDGRQNPQRYETMNFNQTVYRAKTFIDEQGQQVLARNVPRFRIGAEWEQWVRDNISAEFKDTGVGVSMRAEPDAQDSGAMKTHTDTSRNFGLIYLIHRTNEDQWTRWYQEPGQPAHRPNGIHAEDMTKVIELASIQIPLHTWVYIDARILHRAENMQGDRISLMVSYDQDPFGIFE